MPWDSDFEYDLIECEVPDELLGRLQEVNKTPDFRLESVTLARKKRPKPNQKGGSFLKWSAYVVDEQESPEEIGAEVISAAFACAEIDGELGIDRYQATIVWSLRGNGTRDRARVTFELDGLNPAPSGEPARRPMLGGHCPGCAAFDSITKLLRSQLRDLDRSLTCARREAANERERADTFTHGERQARDELAQKLAEIGIGAAKDAREAYRPTEQTTSQILGMLTGAVGAYKAAIDAHASHAQALAEDKSRAVKADLAREGMGMISTLAMKVIAAKLGVTPDAAPSSSATPGASPDRPAMAKLLALRDKLFAAITPKDWATFERRAGSTFVERIKTMESGEIDLVALDTACEDLAAEVSPKDLIALVTELSDPIQVVFMDLGTAIKAARKEAGI